MHDTVCVVRDCPGYGTAHGPYKRAGWASAHPLAAAFLLGVATIAVGLIVMVWLDADRDLAYLVGTVAGGIAAVAMFERLRDV